MFDTMAQSCVLGSVRGRAVCVSSRRDGWRSMCRGGVVSGVGGAFGLDGSRGAWGCGRRELGAWFRGAGASGLVGAGDALGLGGLFVLCRCAWGLVSVVGFTAPWRPVGCRSLVSRAGCGCLFVWVACCASRCGGARLGLLGLFYCDAQSLVVL